MELGVLGRGLNEQRGQERSRPTGATRRGPRNERKYQKTKQRHSAATGPFDVARQCHAIHCVASNKEVNILKLAQSCRSPHRALFDYASRGDVFVEKENVIWRHLVGFQLRVKEVKGRRRPFLWSFPWLELTCEQNSSAWRSKSHRRRHHGPLRRQHLPLADGMDELDHGLKEANSRYANTFITSFALIRVPIQLVVYIFVKIFCNSFWRIQFMICRFIGEGYFWIIPSFDTDYYR